jgi:SAM-dependent methyltransferase
MKLHHTSAEFSKEIESTEFDRLAPVYEELLQDPVRDFFSGEGSQFFHLRKRDVILEYFRDRGIETQGLHYLDVGCGKGELLTLLQGDFKRSAGCDPSSEMLSELRGVEARVQEDPEKLPFESRSFDFISAVCVYHHVPPSARVALTTEVRRLLKPGGIFAVIEHNPYNVITRAIVNRTPVDQNAVLLNCFEVKKLMQSAGIGIDHSKYFLYFPERMYPFLRTAEACLGTIPLGGQYAVFGCSRDRFPE